MFRNYLAAALRNLARNRLYAAISIAGLAVGMAATLLTGLYIRDELTFDHFIPGHETVYVVTTRLGRPGQPDQIGDGSPVRVADWMRLDFPEVRAVARLQQPFSMARPSVRHGEIEAVEDAAWIDPDLFQLLPVPVVAGDLSRPLAPESVVVTRTVARKYFGRAAPVGQLLELGRGKPFRVVAVMEALPANSHLNVGVFGYSREPGQGLSACYATPFALANCGRTYLRFTDAAAAERVRAALPAFVGRHFELPPNQGLTYSLDLVRLDRLHFSPRTVTDTTATGRQADAATLCALGAVAGLILLMAGVNFVNLMTARAARRAVEVGVRKAAGARRRDLVAQFMGESLLYAVVSALCAAALVELALPGLNALLQRSMVFDYWRDPALSLGVVGLTGLTGLLAGVYPALVLSSFRPAVVLKGGAPVTGGSMAVREALVAVQVAVLIGLILATTVIWRQTRYALTEGSRVDTDRMLAVEAACTNALVARVKTLPGVRGAACSGPIDGALSARGSIEVQGPRGRSAVLAFSFIDFGFLELYGVEPLAGRLFSPLHPSDVMPAPAVPGSLVPPGAMVVNAVGARALGFSRPEQAVGAATKWLGLPDVPGGTRIVGVVPDFSIDLLHGPVKPTVFADMPRRMVTLSIKLDGRRAPETLAALDRLWKQSGQPRAMQRQFLDRLLQGVYLGKIREGMLVAALAAVAVFIAALGLFGLAAFTAERRTQEIGVRKAMGAQAGDILGLLLWRFSRPVLWAALIAWPVAWWAMDRWLQGFSSRVALDPWLFLAAACAALVVAWVTVLGQAFRVAREKPIKALRYE